MRLTVLQVAYPLAPVSDDASGGAEQVLARIDAALVREGHRSIVVACEGSRVRGELVATPRPRGELERAREAAWPITRAAIEEVARAREVDLVHLHGVDFHAYLPAPGVPVLATLHLPPSWYPPAALRAARPRTYLQCVSASQRAACPPEARIAATIPNGVDVEALRPRGRKRRFAVVLARVCPEKGLHVAIDAAARARMPLVLAGELFAYAAHQRYFADAIAPRLGPSCRYVGPIGLARKRRLLAAARCLLAPSLVAETSSLVAMEALACGTPVVALRAGALPEIVEHGRTGFVVDDAAAMADGIARAHELDPRACRGAAEARFDARATTAKYLDLYAAIARGRLEPSDGR